eukprot:3941715-Rhodomonas_salina.7
MMRCAVLIEAMLPPMCGTDLAHAAVFTALAYAMFRDYLTVLVVDFDVDVLGAPVRCTPCTLVFPETAAEQIFCPARIRLSRPDLGPTGTWPRA